MTHDERPEIAELDEPLHADGVAHQDESAISEVDGELGEAEIDEHLGERTAD